ncbi:MAG: TRAFs-binding domain-containing protein, partial [Bacteroidota bacterium]
MAEGANHIELLINSGLYQKAIHFLNSNLATDGDNLRYRQLLALCYSRSGALDQALEYFEPIFLQHRNDPETTGIMGGIYKRLFAEHQDQAWARKAAETYSNNFDLTGNYYPGINAASMFVMSGKASAGKELSKRIIEGLDNNSSDVWVNSTLAEAYLLIRERTLSKEFYLKTRKLIGNDWGALSSVYKQLWLLNHYISVPRDI